MSSGFLSSLRGCLGGLCGEAAAEVGVEVAAEDEWAADDVGCVKASGVDGAVDGGGADGDEAGSVLDLQGRPLVEREGYRLSRHGVAFRLSLRLVGGAALRWQRKYYACNRRVRNS